MNYKRISYGKNKLTIVDKWGIWLSSRAIIKFYKELNNKNIKIIDLGSGYNASLSLLLYKYYREAIVVDYDLNPNLVTFDKIKIHKLSIEDSLNSLTDSNYDVIMLINVLEHLNHPQNILNKCYELLKPGGYILINVPTWLGKSFLEYSAFKLNLSPQDEINDHKRYYDLKDLWPLMINANFKPKDIRIKYHKFYLNLFCFSRK